MLRTYCLAVLKGFEPSTFTVTGCCSNQLELQNQFALSMLSQSEQTSLS